MTSLKGKWSRALGIRYGLWIKSWNVSCLDAPSECTGINCALAQFSFFGLAHFLAEVHAC